MHDSMHEAIDLIKEGLDNILGVYSVLEVGSHDVNGSLREWFQNEDTEYLGIDIDHGDSPSVDLVLNENQIYDWPIEDQSYDVSLSANAYEHIEFPWLTFKETVRCVRIGGIIVVHSLWIKSWVGYHAYPIDCWRFTKESFNCFGEYVNKFTEYEVKLQPINIYEGLWEKHEGEGDVWGVWKRIK